MLGYHVRHLFTRSVVLVAYGSLDYTGVGLGTTVIVAPATGKFSAGAVLASLAMGAKVIDAGRSEERLKQFY